MEKSTEYIFDLCEALVSYRGHSSGIALATKVVHQYRQLTKAEKIVFFLEINKRFTPNLLEITADATLLLKTPSSQNVNKLSRSIEGKRQELFRRINMASGGSELLVSMRNDLVQVLPQYRELQEMDNDLIHLFRSWFNPGFLKLKKITWNTSANILEKFIAYEKVHQMEDMDALKNRLRPDMDFYAYFHPSIETEPIIFTEVAYTRGMGKSIQDLLYRRSTVNDLALFDTCTFYSINNCLSGLSRISLGNFLIKRVVEKVQLEQRHIRTFCTLSPVPGFSNWVLENNGINIEPLISKSDFKRLFFLFNDSHITPDFVKEATIQTIMLSLCAHYLINEKCPNRKPLNKVANFHLGNGALISDIVWGGDTSDNGLKASFGIMVNYEYDKKKMDEYHELFFSKKKITFSEKVATILNN